MKLMYAISILLLALMTSAQSQHTADDPFNESMIHTNEETNLQIFDRAIQINPQSADAWYNKANYLAYLGKTSEAKEAYSKAKLLGLELAAPDNVTTGPYKVSFDIGLKKSDYNVIIKESNAVEGLSGDKWTEYYVNIADKTGSNHLATIVIKSLAASIPINTGSDWAKILNSIDLDDPRVSGLRTYSRPIDGTDGGIVE